MKHLFLFIILFCSLSCQTFTKWLGRSPSSESNRTAKHYIFTVHGLAGDATTFGDLLPVLKNHLEYVDPKYEVVTQAFMYGTGRMDADVPMFVVSFEKFLAEFFKVNSLDKDDKISIVCHSQGGLVTTLWYAKTIAGTDARQNEIADHVKAIVTEGTPFWGSGMAHIINDKLPFVGMQNLVYKIMAVGKLEVRDMSLASNRIFDFFRTKAMSRVDLLNTPYMLNISGVAANASKSRRFNVGDRWESDKVVHVPSTRLGFYFYSDSINEFIYEKKASEVIDLKDFSYSQYFSHDPEFKLIETVHTTMGDTLGMAVVPHQCIDAAQCNQPTYAPVFTHLSRCETQESTCDKNRYEFMRGRLYKEDPSFGKASHDALMNQMRTFQVSFNLQLPKNFVPPKDLLKTKEIAKYVKVNYRHGPNESKNRNAGEEDALVDREYPFQDYRIQLGRYKEWGSRVAKHFEATNQLNFQFTGNIKPTDPYWKPTNINPENWIEKSFPVTVTVDIPGLKPRTITLPLRPTYTTFVELNLEP